MAPREIRTLPLTVRRLTVAAVDDVTPVLRRVTLTGDDLAAFEHPAGPQPGFSSPSFDDHLKVILSTDGDDEAALPRQLAHGIEWTPTDNRVTRDFTPGRFDPEARELDLEFVLGHDGPASRWARRATVGDTLAVVGPKSSTVLPADLDWIVLLGDETALPALRRFFAERPTDAPAHAYVALSTPSARVDLPLRPGDEVTWLDARGDAGAELLAAVRDHEWADGSGYVWAGAESRDLLPIRRYLSREVGLPKERLNITGYWHRRDDRAAELAAAGSPEAAMRWFAIRAALALGLLDAVGADPGGGGVSLGECADRTGVPADRLAALLAVLVEAGVVSVDGDGGADARYAPGVLGEQLLADEHARELYDGFHAEQILALEHLADALAEQVPAHTLRHGATLAEQAYASAEVAGELVEHSTALVYILGGLVADPRWAAHESVGLIGPGAAVVAELFAREATGPGLVVMETGVMAEALRATGTRAPTDWADGLRPCGAVVAVLALECRTDAEAVQLLRDLREVAGSVTLVESVRPDALGHHAAMDSLVQLAATGVPPRDADAIAALAREAGWSAAPGRELGWGRETIELTAP